MLVLYGSQTGNTQAFAHVLASFAKARGIAVRVSSMADFVAQAGPRGGVISALSQEGTVVLMSSTFYNGEFPDNALSFWKALESADTQTASHLLKNVKFAVFGLGNKANKDNFNVAAKRLESRMKELGAKQLVPAGFGDEFSSSGHEAAFRPFVKSIWFALGQTATTSASLPVSFRVQPAPGAALSPAALPGFEAATVKTNEVLSKPGTAKEIRLVSIEANDGYPVAGHVLVTPTNPPALVDRAYNAILLPGGTTIDSSVRVTSVDDPSQGHTTTVRRLLAEELELQGLATRSFLEALSVMATDPKEKERLVEVAEGMEEGNEYGKLTNGEVFSFVDAMEKFPSARLSIEQLLSTVPRLQPRYYSIASSPLASPNQIDLVFAADVWATLSNPSKKFVGLASGYLAALKPGDKVQVKVQQSPILVPSPDVPVVAVGLGSGIGVARGLVQHWAALKAQGKKVAPIELFYGFRHADKDFVFEEELGKYASQGVCNLSTAAMDQGSLITDSLSKSESAVKALLDSKGVFVYTGPAGVVPQAVEMSIQEAIAAVKGVHPQAAAAELAEVKGEMVPGKPNRWTVEAYTREVDVENLLKDYAAKAEQDKPLAAVFEGAKMLCMQCEQTFQGKGCTTVGVCGKTPEVAALQDLLVDVVKRLGWYNHEIRTLVAKGNVPAALADKAKDRETDRFTLLALFSTLTNVNFDSQAIADYILKVGQATKSRGQLYADICKAVGAAQQKCPIPDLSVGLTDPAALAKKGELVGLLAKFRTVKNDVVVGLAEMLVYGLKGVSAYADHAVLLGEEDARIFDYVNEALAFLIGPDAYDLDKVVGMLLRCGEANLITMETLHRANTVTHGAQSPAVVPVAPKPGKAILISGHDMKFLEELLEQTKGTGINVYTHGEMLPAFGYPKLREYGNLAGHFGVAWQRQTVEFPHFPGPVVMTTNCLVPPKEEMKDRIFTAGAVGFPGCEAINGFDFSSVIAKAQQMPGFKEGETEYTYPLDPFGKPAKSYNVGFALETVLSVAPTVIGAIEKGLITRFYYVGGCDGFEGERSYYSELMENLPPTSVVLTSGCGKYRVLGDKLQYQTIGDTGIPRLLDLGQCNDAYSAIQIAVALANHFKCGVNDLPLNLVVSWFEQKAVAILLTLLHLNLRGVRIGPRLPAFVRPAALQFLVDKFDLKATGNALEDLKQMEGKA
ncbi:Prismane-like protein [Hyaloraphidium curvatum]|nr:Prismane-like protein [Hyaloraphidium curvatum]